MAGLRKGASCSYWVLLGFLIFLVVASLACLGVIIWMVFDKPYCEVSAMSSTAPPTTRATTERTTQTTTKGPAPRPGVFVLEDLRADLSSGDFQWFNSKLVEEVELLAELDPAFSYSDCRQQSNNQICLRRSDGFTLTATSVQRNSVTEPKCYLVEQRVANTSDQNPTTCFQYGGHHWYGAGQVHDQHWPVERWSLDMQEFVAGDSYDYGVFGGVLERFWLSSAGVSVHVPHDVPLLVSMNANNDKKLCFSSKLKDTVYRRSDGEGLSLRYEVCGAGSKNNLTSLYKYTSRRYWSKPSNRPNLDTLVKPIWSTWALYKKNINETSLLEFVSRIISLNLPISQLEIDDDWSMNYGDWMFNRAKFPDPRTMISRLKNLVPAVTVWVHPFVATDSLSFQQLGPQGLLMNVRESEEPIPGLVRWWNSGLAGYLDFSNSQTSDWFLATLQRLQTDVGIDSFKFDAGETKWMPLHTDMNVSYFDPSEYISHFVNIAVRADRVNRRQEVRVGYRTQDAPLLVRMMDRRSRWGVDNGLKTVIPTTLTFGLIGYPFVLPDMIGGNAYEGASVNEELFIRWLQVSIFLPSMQFSIGPWSFSQMTIDHTRSLLAVRESYRWLFDRLSREAVSEGWPMVRPLWWLDPTDQVTFNIDDEFMLGDTLLVAPVVEPQATTRDIYLPIGRWRDMNSPSGTVLSGARWLRNYSSPLLVLPYFQKV